MLLREHILREAEILLPEIVEIRRHIHQHPELSYAEYETAAFISSKLDAMGIEHRTGIAGTGIVGFIRGEGCRKRPYNRTAGRHGCPAHHRSRRIRIPEPE